MLCYMSHPHDIPYLGVDATDAKLCAVHEYLDKHVCLTMDRESVIALELSEQQRQLLLTFLPCVYRCTCGKVFLRF